MNVYTPEIIGILKAAKRHLPAGWSIVTIDYDEPVWLELHIDRKEFEKYNLRNRMAIAEVYEALKLRIRDTGLYADVSIY